MTLVPAGQPTLLDLPAQPPQMVQMAQIEPPEADGSTNASEGAIRTLGMQSAIRLSRIPASEQSPYTYRIVDGRRRYRACLSGKLAEIPAIIRDDTPETAALATIALNLGRTGNLLSEARAIRALMDRGYTHERIAQESKIKVSRIRAIAPLCALPDDVLQGVADGRMSGKTAIELSKLPQHAQERALTAFRATAGKFTAEALKDARVASVTVDETEAVMSLDFMVNTSGGEVALFDPLDTAAARVRSLAKAEGVSVKELAQRLLEGGEA